MNQKKILIVSRSFYPEKSPRSFRTSELVKEFARQGHEVTLLTLRQEPHHTEFEKEFGVTIKDFGPLRFPSNSTKSAYNWTSWLRRIVRRGLLQLFEYPDIELMFRVKNELKDESNYDLLISIAVPHTIHWGVARAWRKSNPITKNWIADCGDPYMGQTLDSFNKMFYFKYFEKDFCRKADYISVPIEEAKKGYYPEFRNKIRVIPQGFKFEEVEINPSNYVPNPVPTFAYAGGFIPGGRDPRTLLEYLTSLDREYKFIIYTKSIGLVKPWVEKSNGRMEIRDYIERKKLINILSKMDFLVNIENKSPLMMPSKLIDYYLTGRPVLNVTSSLTENGQLDQFLNGDYSDRYNFINMDRFRIENICRNFLSLIQKSENTNAVLQP